jgi:hypothetical protein
MEEIHPFNAVTADPFDLVAAVMEQSLDSSLSKYNSPNTWFSAFAENR